MKQILIIPDKDNIEGSLSIAKKYSLGFEYNDFFYPDVLDDEKRLNEIIKEYKKYDLPHYSTVHGAFFDVIPFSLDSKIKEVSELRIEQSIATAYRIGAKAVVFHTNYNPFLNVSAYIEGWIKVNVKFWSEMLEKYPDIYIYLENITYIIKYLCYIIFYSFYITNFIIFINLHNNNCKLLMCTYIKVL